MKKVALRDVQNDRRTLIRNDPKSCILGLNADAVKVSGTERPIAESFWATLPVCYKKSRIGRKKVALRDVQNDRRTLIRNDPESCVLGPSVDAIKVSGTERPTAESFWATLPECNKKSRIGEKKVALRDVQNDRKTLIHNDPESCVLGLSADAVKVSGTERPTSESFWATLPVCYKKSPIERKKVALRDVQNDKRTLIRNDPESCVLGLSADAVKVSGTERPTPESFWATLPVCYKKSRIDRKKVALRDMQNDRRTLIRNDPESCVLGLSGNGVKVSGIERPTPESFWATLPVCYKKSRIGKKKVALRNVQNDRRTLIRNDPESCVLGLGADPVKVSGTKRLTPECPLNEHVTHASRNSDSELGKRRVQEASNKKSDFLKLRKYFHNKPELPQQHPEEKEINTSSVPASAPTPTATVTTFSPDRPPVPISLEKPGNGLPAAESNCVQLTSESDTPHSADSKENTDQERKEQFLHLQKPQKHCYEYDQRDYIHLFRHLSPVELNRCAVELEKRSIQLSVEEGKEIERMKALNIFGKSSLTNNPLQTFPQVQTKE